VPDGVLIFLAGLGIGIAVGAALAWERLVRRERPQIVVTPEVLHQINAQMVRAWLDKNGLVFMPAGRDFRWPRQSDEARR